MEVKPHLPHQNQQLFSQGLDVFLKFLLLDLPLGFVHLPVQVFLHVARVAMGLQEQNPEFIQAPEDKNQQKVSFHDQIPPPV